MEKYHYLFSKGEIHSAVKARKEYLKNEAKDPTGKFKKSWERFGNKINTNTVGRFSNEVSLHLVSKPSPEYRSFNSYLELNDPDSFKCNEREIPNANSPLNRYLASPYVIDHYKEDKVFLEEKINKSTSALNEAQERLNNVNFPRNWIQRHIAWTRFSENRYVRQQKQIIKHEGHKINKNTAIKNQLENEIREEKTFQNTFELNNSVKLEALRGHYNQYVKQTVDPLANPETVNSLLNKPQFGAPTEVWVNGPAPAYAVRSQPALAQPIRQIPTNFGFNQIFNRLQAEAGQVPPPVQNQAPVEQQVPPVQNQVPVEQPAPQPQPQVAPVEQNQLNITGGK